MVTAPSWSADPALFLADLGRAELYPADGLSRLAEEVTELDVLLLRYASPFALDRYLAAASGHEERRDRWAVVATVIKAGLLDVRLPARPGWPQQPGITKRVLRPLEQGLLRWCATRTAVKAATIALSEAGATSNELHLVDADDLFHDSGWFVRLPGDSAVPPRVRQLSDWAAAYLTQLARRNDVEAPLVYAGHSDDPAKRQCAMLTKIKTLLKEAGLGEDRTVSPESIRHTTARRVYDQAGLGAGLEAAGEFLNIADLDRIARRIDITPAPVAATSAVAAVRWSNPLA